MFRLLFLFVLLPAGLAFSAEHKVASAADIARITGKLAAGDTIVMADGDWRDQAVVFRGRGTAEKPITLRAATAGKVVLTGRSTLEINGEWLVVSGLLMRDGSGPAEGIALRGRNNRVTECAMIGGTYKHFLRIFGTRNRVDRCYFAGKTSDQPTLQVESEPAAPNYHRIDGNHFGPREPLGRNGGETIRVGYSGQSMNNSRTLVERNLFERCDGEIEIISSKSCENVYRHNTFLDCAGMLTLRHGNRCLVEGNFFIAHRKQGSGGVRVIGEDHIIVNNYIEGVDRGGFWITSGVPDSPLNGYFPAKRCVIAFNTVVDSRGPCVEVDAGFGGSGRTLRPEDITIAHNLFSVPKAGELIKGTEGTGYTWSGNLAFGAATDHAGFLVADPLLIRSPDGLWRPAAGSPARGAATDGIVSVKADIDGQPRSGQIDAGCDQLSDAPVTNRPLTAKDVGPQWLER